MKTLRTLLAAMLLAAGFTTVVSAQERPGSLTITVYDTTGAAIAAANVNLTAPDGKITQQLADEKGTLAWRHVGESYTLITSSQSRRDVH